MILKSTTRALDDVQKNYGQHSGLTPINEEEILILQRKVHT